MPCILWERTHTTLQGPPTSEVALCNCHLTAAVLVSVCELVQQRKRALCPALGCQWPKVFFPEGEWHLVTGAAPLDMFVT